MVLLEELEEKEAVEVWADLVVQVTVVLVNQVYLEVLEALVVL
jgi:hypothetical protein